MHDMIIVRGRVTYMMYGIHENKVRLNERMNVSMLKSNVERMNVSMLQWLNGWLLYWLN